MAKKRYIPKKKYRTPTRNYKDEKYSKWRLAVKKRDGFKCKWPGCEKKKVYCHHIRMWAKYPTLRYIVSNGICLCYQHHKLVTGKEESYAAFLISLIRKKKE